MKNIIIFCVLLMSFFPLSINSQEISIEEYTKAVAQSPEAYKHKFLLYRGRAYVQEGKKNSALSDFSKSILLKPTPEAYMERGKIYLDNGRFDAAIQDFNMGIKLRTASELYSLRSKAYLSKRMFELALLDASNIIDLNPRNPEAYNTRISVYYEMEEYDKAIIDCDSALKINPKNSHALRMKQLSKERAVPPQIVLQGASSIPVRTRLYGSSSSSKTKKKSSGTETVSSGRGYQIDEERINRLKKAALGSGHHVSSGPAISTDTFR